MRPRSRSRGCSSSAGSRWSASTCASATASSRSSFHSTSTTHAGYRVGSVFYAWVVPGGDGHARVTLLGKPMFDGRIACTPGLATSCEPDLTVTIAYAHDVDGHVEGDVVRGVFAELALEDAVAPT